MIAALSAPADVVPKFNYMHPTGGQQGATIEIEVGGYLDPWPVGIWTDCPGLKFTPIKEKFVHEPCETESSPGALLYERRGIGKVTVEIAEDAAIGNHLVRVYTPYGASAPMSFAVGHHPELSDLEPNDTIQDAQPISQLPVTINGRLWGDHARVVLGTDIVQGAHFRSDSDTYAVTLEAGQWLIASTESHGLGYAVDTLLDLRDENGVKLAHNNDVYFDTFDSLLAYKAENAGTYMLQVTAIHIQRGVAMQKYDLLLRDSAVYRLTLSHGPHTRYTYPAAVQRGKKTPLQVYAYNLPSPSGFTIAEMDLTNRRDVGDHVLLTTEQFANRLSLPVTDDIEIQEIEPNNQRDLAQPVSMPLAVNGRIIAPADKDYFAFGAQEDQQFTFTVTSYKAGFPLLAVLKVEDEKGEQMAIKPNTSTSSRLSWKAPKEGVYYLRVSELTTTGGREYIYRVKMDAGQHFTPTVSANQYRIEPGKSVDVKFSLDRHNFTSPLNVVAEGLPDGVTFATSQMPFKDNDGTVKLTAAAGAKSSNQPIRFRFFSTEQPQAILDATAAVQGMKLSYVRYPEVDASSLTVTTTHDIWLTVTPRQRPEPDRVVKIFRK